MTKIPHDDILKGLYKLRIREFEKLKTELELYDLEIHQRKLGLYCFRNAVAVFATINVRVFVQQ